MLGQGFTYFPPPLEKLLQEGSFPGLPFFERGLLFIKGTDLFIFFFFFFVASISQTQKAVFMKKSAPRLLNVVTLFFAFLLWFSPGVGDCCGNSLLTL